MRTIPFTVILLALITAACSNNKLKNDASGVFEATEIIVSSEVNGKIMKLDIAEGENLNANQEVGLIDSTQLHLQKLLLEANKKALLSSRPDVKTQIDATKKEIERLNYEKSRIKKLLEGDVATQKQLDDINAQLKILDARLIAQKSALNTNRSAINRQGQGIDIQIQQIEDQLRKCRISSPIDGIILVKYAEQGELATMGKPLFKIADTKEMILRAYVTADQLHQLSIGQQVRVSAEFGKEDRKDYQGTVSWISEKAEFTPKTVQTQDERANLVYAVKVRIKNDGFAKIGMYGGIKF